MSNNDCVLNYCFYNICFFNLYQNSKLVYDSNGGLEVQNFNKLNNDNIIHYNEEKLLLLHKDNQSYEEKKKKVNSFLGIKLLESTKKKTIFELLNQKIFSSLRNNFMENKHFNSLMIMYITDYILEGHALFFHIIKLMEENEDKERKKLEDLSIQFLNDQISIENTYLKKEVKLADEIKKLKNQVKNLQKNEKCKEKKNEETVQEWEKRYQKIMNEFQEAKMSLKETELRYQKSTKECQDLKIDLKEAEARYQETTKEWQDMKISLKEAEAKYQEKENLYKSKFEEIEQKFKDNQENNQLKMFNKQLIKKLLDNNQEHLNTISQLENMKSIMATKDIEIFNLKCANELFEDI